MESRHDFALLYVGKRQPDEPAAAVKAQADEYAQQGKLLEVERADFGLLFAQMDAFVVHGGLGTTVEALRMRKPTAAVAGHWCRIAEQGLGVVRFTSKFRRQGVAEQERRSRRPVPLPRVGG